MPSGYQIQSRENIYIILTYEILQKIITQKIHGSVKHFWITRGISVYFFNLEKGKTLL